MVFSIVTKFCNHHHNQFQNIFITTQQIPIPISSHCSFAHKPSLPQPTDTLSVSIDLPFWTFNENGIIKYVFFCVWLFTHRRMFSRCIHVSACISTSFLLKLFFKSFINLSNLYTQHGARTHDPKIKSCKLLQLSQPGAPLLYSFLFLRFHLFIWDRETQRESMSRDRGRGGGRSRLLVELGAQFGDRSQDLETMTRAQGRCLTTWATQTPLFHSLLWLNNIPLYGY